MQHTHDSGTPEQHPAHAYGHYVLIWLGLVALTALTVALAGINLGRWVILTALTIAGIKGVLVLLHFMHLRTEDRIFKIFVLVSVVTLAIFIILTFFDYAFR